MRLGLPELRRWLWFDDYDDARSVDDDEHHAGTAGLR
jgi:hypothetical protein